MYSCINSSIASCLLPICSEIYNCIDKQIKFPLLLLLFLLLLFILFILLLLLFILLLLLFILLLLLFILLVLVLVLVLLLLYAEHKSAGGN